MEKRIIGTGMYSGKAFQVVDCVFGQLSDGIWENSRAMEKYWWFASAKRADDGEVVVEVEETPRDRKNGVGNGFYGMPAAKVLDFLAGKVKAAAKAEIGDLGGEWRRDCSRETVYLSRHGGDVTFADVYCVYECLKGRGVDGKYPAGVAESVVGKLSPADESTAKKTALEAYEAEKKAMAERYAAELKALDEKFADAVA
jgi:hypothetical protein